MLHKDKSREHGKFYDLKADVIAGDDDMLIFAEVPGMEISDITISIVGGYMVIKGMKEKNYLKSKALKAIYDECPHGKFVKYIPIPKTCYVEKYNADLKEGILKILVNLAK